VAVVEICRLVCLTLRGWRHIQNLCGFSTPTAMGQSFIMTLYYKIEDLRCFLFKKFLVNFPRLFSRIFLHVLLIDNRFFLSDEFVQNDFLVTLNFLIIDKVMIRRFVEYDFNLVQFVYVIPPFY
jgi:hypothetical protein